MSELSENTINVIKQIDPDLPQYLDFKNLRKEGLEHIGNLAGKIWTDHNAHDPGITTLEVLVYALIDLGYKTNLPFEDLITQDDNQHKDDNFLTPLEILTINPVTITDYRKLLLEIEGVRNAWLEPVGQEIALYIDQNKKSLSCLKPTNPACKPTSNPEGGFFIDEKKCKDWLQYEQPHLNGLYKIYIEKENEVTDENQLQKEVQKRLNEHRNLCEDFTDIKILEPINFGVCVDVEIRIDYDPKVVYSKIIMALKNAIQPEINYYTLNELLDKGKAIDDIFAGRPYSEKSFGFVDTDELEGLERRSEIHLSDLYNVILSIEGVRKIKKIHINKQKDDAEALKWTQIIGSCEVPVFSMENTCVDIYSEQGLLKIDKFKIYQSFSFNKKFELPLTSLDSEIPFGVHHEDLQDYYSIQNDFPVVYGIGEDGLPESATLLRKTQALQLKGYLLFYDQILANYSSQLANIRSLFSLKSEEERVLEDKKTYFTQIPESIPGIEDLLRFYDQKETQLQSAVLAYPVLDDDNWKKALEDLDKNPRSEFSIKNLCDDKNGAIDLFTFSSIAIRSIYINQLIDSFYNQQYTIQILEDRFGCFFVLRPSLPDDVLIVGTKRYESISKATSEAKNVAFIASTDTSYNLVTNTSENLDPDQHYFGITYHPTSYIDLIQELTENKEEYRSRRTQFLDHLLARFGEQFTDYTLLQYKGKLSEAELSQELINDQSSYINEFEELSRNRGKAFSYLEPSWNTNNVSGFEKRVSLLSGINNYQRRNLCNFDVTECYRLLLNDPKGIPLFRSNRSYETKEALHFAAKKVLLQLRDSKSFPTLEKNLNGFNSQTIGRIFSEEPTEEHIIITKYHFNQQLLNSENKEVGLSKNLTSEAIALKKKDEFINSGIVHIIPNSFDSNKKYRLLSVAKENYYVDISILDESLKINPIETWKWYGFIPESKEKLSSEHPFNSLEKAWEDVIEKKGLEAYLTTHKTGYKWALNIPNLKITFQGVDCYPDRNKAIAAWRKAKVSGSTIKNYTLEKEKNADRIVLRNEKKKIIAVAIANKKDPGNSIEDIVTVFNNRKTKPNYTKEADKIGFRIPMLDEVTPLVSYCIYDSKKEALQEMGKVFELGSIKKNYLQSGDEGNPEYNFLLKDKQDSFLALQPEHFEIASNRDAALNSVLRFFKTSEAPVSVKKEPNNYSWSLFYKEKIVLKSTSEFSSETEAKSNFDKIIAIESLKSCYELCKEHLYQFKVTSTPSQFNFIYGNSNSNNELNPIFISKDFYENTEEAQVAYTNFVKKLPQLSLKFTKGKESSFEYGLYDKKTLVASQYVGELGQGTAADAKELTNYISKIYVDNKTPNEAFVISEMAENQRKSYEWRFYKKNAPLARNPHLFDEKEPSEAIKRSVCDIIPPINFKKCPVKEIVVCPDKDKDMYHYQVCFNDNDDNEFVLISYVGYQTYEEAQEAWEKEWLEVINLARDPEQYRDPEDPEHIKGDGKISLIEQYKNPESKTCHEASFIAVIPEKRKTSAKGQELIDDYTQQADLFPIYKVEVNEDDSENNEEIEACIGTYKYRVVVKDTALLNGEIKPTDNTSFQGTLLWESVACFNSIEETIDAYQHFYILAGTPNNCRILCEKGKFYVGLIEVLAESSCDYTSEADAWDDAFPEEKKDLCGDCLPGGVRAFVYAAEDDKNYIPVCDKEYWKFKVVSHKYFVADHNCWYNSEARRDEQIDVWRTELEKLVWSTNMPDSFFKNDSIISFETPSNNASFEPKNESFKAYCDIVHDIRECLKMCSKGAEKTEQDEEIKICLGDKLKAYICTEEDLKNETCTKEKLVKHHKAQELLNKLIESESAIADLKSSVKQFPIYKTDEGYCFKLYWEANDKIVSKGGLQPCGCEEETVAVEIDKEETDDIETSKITCEEVYPFISSNCYSCCSQAFEALKEFCELFQSKKTYELAPVSKTKYGPYSFQIIDTSQELAYHPQQYNCLQDVEDAIQMTKACVDNTGMHLLEHILLRPKTIDECGHTIFTGDDVSQDFKNCLLPICPDYCCPIDWKPDIDKDDPCAADPDANKIYYLPGADPYSFWATVALPAWVKRFRTKESREIFEKLLYKEVPALVGLHILWLSPRDMCKFEDEYRRWLDWIASKKEYLCNPEKGLPICGLSACIKVLKSEPACESIPSEQGDCECRDDEWVNDDECCLPLDTEGTIFWSCCEEPDTPLILGLTSNMASSAVVKEKAVEKSKMIKNKGVSKAKTPTKKVIEKKEPVQDLMALVRQRKPKYLTNIKALADEDMAKTKSYERTVFFLQNTPTIAAYVQFVNFFKRYSLQKDNAIEAFLGLIKNATWHLFDGLTLQQKGSITNEELKTLKSSLEDLNKKGLSLKTVGKEWKIEEVRSLANTKVVNQLKELLKE
jgi:hypothetical protein